MPFLPAILAVLAVWTAVVIVPGPNFLATTHHALARSRRVGVACALGIATGTAVWASSAVFGLALILAKAGWAYDALRVAGAVYLIAVGLRAVVAPAAKAAPPAAPALANGGLARAFRAGLLVDLSNTKAATFFTSLFVVMLPAAAPLWLDLATVGAVVAIAAAWYSLAAVVVSMPPVARLYRRSHRRLNRLAGGLFVFFGGRLLLSR